MSDNGNELAVVEKADVRSVQDRVQDPSSMMGGVVGIQEAYRYMRWFSDVDQQAPMWGTPISRADYLEGVWRSDSRLSGILFTMVSRVASLGWSLVGPAEQLEQWYELFSEADEEGWTQFVKLIYMDYLSTDEGSVMETGRDSYPDGQVRHLWHMDARKTIPGPVPINGKVYPLIFQDNKEWKALKRGQFYRTCSLPTTDQNGRRLGFCFLSRFLRYARLGDDLLKYQEERVGNAPPEGIVTVTGLTRGQVEQAFAEYEAARQQQGSQLFPGILWFVSNGFGQEANVSWTSFRDVWQSFSEREWLESFFKVAALDAGVDVAELYQVEFHGATKAASWLQHTKARGKGPAEFIVAFERWASRITPKGIRFFFDTPDDEQDLTTEQIKAARIKNAKELWLPGPDGERLLEKEQILEMLAEQKVIPARYVTPKEVIATDVIKAMGETPGIVRWPDGHVEVRRPYWNVGKDLLLARAKALVDGTQEIDADLARQLVPIIRRWQDLTPLFTQLLQEWEQAILTTMANDPAALAPGSDFWTEWGSKLREQVTDAYIASALAGGRSLGLEVSFDQLNLIAREVADEQMFKLVKLDGPESVVRSRMQALDDIRQKIASGQLPFSELEPSLQPWFDAARAKKIAVSENTNLWSISADRTAKYANMKYKSSVRADVARSCPSGVCDLNAAAGWISIDQPFPSGHMLPSYHPGCYCLVRYIL